MSYPRHGSLRDKLRWCFTTEGGYITAAVAGVAALSSIAGGVMASKSASKAGKLSSQEKRAFDQEYWQTQAAKRWQELMQPFILEELGLQATYDDNNNIVSVARKDVTTPGEKMKERIAMQAGEQTEKAMRGELPLDPATERDIRLSRVRLGDQVRRTFGPAGDLSSGGRAALNAQGESEAIARSRFNREQLSMLEGIFSRNLGDPEARRIARASAMSGVPRNVMDFAQVMPQGAFAQGASERFQARQDANAYAHLGNMFGRGLTDVSQALQDRYRNQAAPSSFTPMPSVGQQPFETDIPGIV